MEKLSLTQKQYITEIANIHESELAKQNEDYSKSRLSVGLREEMINHGLKYDTDLVWLETQKEQLIGFIWARYLKNYNKVIIEMLYVDEAFRKQGIAKRFKNEIESWAQSQGAQKIESTVANHNVQMQQLNLNMDYHVSKVIMTKNLRVNNEDNREK
ncbi:GNAT family N-acetyltransferase [Staphylococcus equorum]|uniref:GNAT family N-acetyltransferase n=1 Tax=Staphylococcus equorum TaxID=246432 RepID=A0A9X4R1Y9_9STAP|nr:GNAT family N-acetyltransferase [Staphylococcus equorum]MDG0842792.1 GNAT family N-acetyltransferase [Staphylococcus equorum]MDG0859586.1 GNAT family N-acetyltransferase [Staphylococcus equorum]